MSAERINRMLQDVYHTFHVGVNVFVVRDGRLLLGKRKTVYGAGTWGLPGGHLEPREAMTEAAARELLEETGLTVKTLAFSNLVNDRSGNQHYIQVGFAAQDAEGEPEVKEPERCEAWDWFALDALPEVFPPHKNQIENFIRENRFADA